MVSQQFFGHTLFIKGFHRISQLGRRAKLNMKHNHWHLLLPTLSLPTVVN